MIILVLTTALLSKGWSSTFGVAVLLVPGLLLTGRDTREAMPPGRWVRMVLVSALLASFYACWLAWCHTDGGDFPVRQPIQRDTPHYVALAAYLDRFGVETPQPHFLAGLDAARAPYHYLDAWLAVMVSRALHVGHLLAYVAISQSVLALTLVLLVGALLVRLFGLAPPVAVLSAFLALLPGLEPVARFVGETSRGTFAERLLGGIEGYVMPPLFVNKFIPAVIFLLAYLLAVTHHRSRKGAPWFVAALVLAYFPYLPFAGTVLVVELWRRRGEVLKAGAGWGTVLAAGVMCLVLLIPELDLDARGGFFFLARSGTRPQSANLGALRVIVGGGLRLTLLMALLLAAARLGCPRPRQFRRVLHLALPIAAGTYMALLAWAATHETIDSWQLLTTVSSGVLSVLLAIGLGGFGAHRSERSSSRATRYVVLAALSVVSVLWINSSFRGLKEAADRELPAELTLAVKARVASHEQQDGIGVWLRGAASFKQVYDYNLGSATHPVAFLVSDYPFTLTVPSEPLHLSEGFEGAREEAMLRRSALYRATGWLPTDAEWERELTDAIARQKVDYALVDADAKLAPALIASLHDCARIDSPPLSVCSVRR